MGFPEFTPDKARILYFSRGRGRGHAVPDMEIERALRARDGGIEVRFVSYGTGAIAFAEAGVPLIDTGLPDAGGTAEMSAIAGRLIRWLNPDLVVSHEEFAAAPAAKIFDKPAVFITSWFSEPDSYAMRAMTFADEVLFLGPSGVFDEPPALREKVRYLGPLMRSPMANRAQRTELRRKHGVPEDALVLSVFPGSWTEQRAPAVEAILAAFDLLAGTKRLVWVAGSDCEAIRARTAGRGDMHVMERTSRIDEWMALSDVAITKSSRKAVYELAHLGVPQVALTYGLNPGDDRAAGALPEVPVLAAGGLRADALAEALQSLLRTDRSAGAAPLQVCTGADCAAHIVRALGRRPELRANAEAPGA